MSSKIVAVIDDQGNPIEVDPSSLTGDPIEDTQALLFQALQYNRFFVDQLPGGSAFSDIAVMVRADAVQF